MRTLCVLIALFAAACAPNAPVPQPPPQSQTTTQPAPAPPGAVRLTLQQDGTEARYRAREQLANRPLPREAVGATTGVSGALTLGPDGAVVPDRSVIKVDLQTLKSGQDLRDNYLRRNTLQVEPFPTAGFAVKRITGIASPLPSSGQATFHIAGDFTVHGVTKPATWDVSAQFTPQEVTGMATTIIKLEDFGMTRPTVGPVLSIEENIILELDFKAARSS